MTSALRIGTRGSPLARAQAAEVRDRLAAAHPELAREGAVELVAMTTTGDRIQDRTLARAGGKGLFTKEIEEALAAGAVDIAVHSMKDMPTRLPDGLMIACLLPREDPRDAFIGRTAKGIFELPSGAVVGTASLRRTAQLLHRRPDLTVVPLRGNVHTRLRKLAAGEIDATLLAVAGLRRLNLGDTATAVLPTGEMLPAVAQGAIGVEARVDDERVLDLLAPLDHLPTMIAVSAERALLGRLDGSCRTPIAALAELEDSGTLTLKALVAKPDGSLLVATRRRGSVDDAAAIGRDAGDELRARLPSDYLNWVS